MLEDEKQTRAVQMDQELVEMQETLSKENQDELNNLAKKHKAENSDMVENMLEDEGAEEAGEVEGDEEDEEDNLKAQEPAAPDCPVCFELMSPPTRIFHCGAGHLVCGTCRPRLQVFH